ncbi:MAG: PAS domain-containing protein [Kiloniellaceae bacterium]
MRVDALSIVSGVQELPAPSREVTDFLEAWRAARSGALVPRKRDFDPLNVHRLLPYLWIYLYDRDEDTFICRLAGEQINAAWGYSIAGHLSQDIFGPRDNDVIVSIWKTILDTPLVHYGKEEALAGTSLYNAERLVLPLADESGGINFILGFSRYSFGRSPTGPRSGLVENAYHILCRDL